MVKQSLLAIEQNKLKEASLLHQQIDYVYKKSLERNQAAILARAAIGSLVALVFIAIILLIVWQLGFLAPANAAKSTTTAPATTVEAMDVTPGSDCLVSCIHGDCVNGHTCRCFTGYSGPACDLYDFDCKELNGCNRNGTCVGPKECLCNDGFLGPDCKNKSQGTMVGFLIKGVKYDNASKIHSIENAKTVCKNLAKQLGTNTGYRDTKVVPDNSVPLLSGSSASYINAFNGVPEAKRNMPIYMPGNGGPVYNDTQRKIHDNASNFSTNPVFTRNWESILGEKDVTVWTGGDMYTSKETTCNDWNGEGTGIAATWADTDAGKATETDCRLQGYLVCALEMQVA